MPTTMEQEILAIPQLAAQWARIRGRLQNEVGDVEYRTWLKQMSLAGLDGDEVTVTLPTRFLRDWVRSHYRDRLTALWQAENPDVRRVDVRVGNGLLPITGADALTDPAPEPPPVVHDLDPPLPVSRMAEAPGERSDPRSELNAPLDPRFTFDGFVVGKPNEFAYACARRVAERRPAPGSIRCSSTAGSAWARPT